MTIAPSWRTATARYERMLERHTVVQAAVLLAYGCAFTALHHFAAQWAAGALFSLWFPTAGLRFAFLWRVGAAKAPAAALAELFVQLVTGEASLGAAPVLGIVGS